MMQETADKIADVFTLACVDALHAMQRKDDDARRRFHSVADALEVAYPREVRAVHEDRALFASWAAPS